MAVLIENCCILSYIFSHKKINFLKVNFTPNPLLFRGLSTSIIFYTYNDLFLVHIIALPFLTESNIRKFCVFCTAYCADIKVCR